MGFLKRIVVVSAGIVAAFAVYVVNSNPNSSEFASNDGQYVDLKNRDGRIGYSVFGAPDGQHTVIFFPGVPGSRFSRIPDDTVLRQKGVRVIAVERPGVGLSTPLHTYSMQSYADDIGELTDALGVREFGIVGFSGGGPFALAATARLQAKTTGLALIGSVYRYVDGAPSLNDFRTLGFSNGVYLQTHFPLFTSVMFRVLAPAVVKPEMAARMGLESMDAADKRLFERNVFWRNALQAEYAEMFRNGVTSFLQHGKLLLDQNTTHTFSAANITVPLAVWHGLDDVQVPPECSKRIQADNPSAVVELLPHTGHYSALDARFVDAALFACRLSEQ